MTDDPSEEARRSPDRQADAGNVPGDLAAAWTKALGLAEALAAQTQWMQELATRAVPKLEVSLPDFTLSSLLLELTQSFKLTSPESLLGALRPALERLADVWSASLPMNWREVKPGGVEAAIDVMSRTGIPLAWIPRTPIVEMVLEAGTDSERTSILLDHQGEILEDLRACLAELAAEDLLTARDAAENAINAFEGGHAYAAQALAAAALTACIEHVIGWKLGRMRQEFEAQEPLSASISRFRLVATCAVLARATLSRFDVSKGDPIPSHFNRHASLHTVSPIQYTPLNALISLMLLVSLLRELQSRS
jgi:hypothetical protein